MDTTVIILLICIAVAAVAMALLVLLMNRERNRLIAEKSDVEQRLTIEKNTLAERAAADRATLENRYSAERRVLEEQLRDKIVEVATLRTRVEQNEAEREKNKKDREKEEEEAHKRGEERAKEAEKNKKEGSNGGDPPNPPNNGGGGGGGGNPPNPPNKYNDQVRALSSAKSVADNASSIAKEMANIAGRKRVNVPRMDLSHMTNEQMQKAIQRDILERQYDLAFNTSRQKAEARKERTQVFLQNTGSALAVTASALGIALTVKKLIGK